MYKTFKTDFAGREIVIETGKMAQLANGSALVRYGDTVILSTATSSNSPREGIDYFPLAVDYEERLYAVGKIPGGFIKREGKPSEKAVLTSRLIDRPIRPLFPDDLRNDVTVVNSVLSVDQNNSPEIAAMIGSSVALAISDIPWNGPIGGINVGLVDEEIVFNPDAGQREKSSLNLTIAGTEDKVIMIEAGAREVSENTMLEAIMKGHGEIRKIVAFIKEIVMEVGKPKYTYESSKVPDDILNDVDEFGYEKMKVAVLNEDKQVREENVELLTEEIQQHFAEKYPEMEEQISGAVYALEKRVVREFIINEDKRVDGRALNEIRPLSAEVGVLPRTHGSGLFQRGQTQVLTIVTLGALGEVQMLDGVDLEDEKRYMHHYNFPSYSVGETRPSRGPGRREIGHGALAERALEPVIPDEESFPYAIRVVSEVIMSNGSTSQGSVCGSTLALMDAGVPIKEPVAGISAGLVTMGDGSGQYKLLMDIQGVEDFFGDMDFKVAGTKNGITAVQVDIKTDGLTENMIKDALELTKEGRLEIIDNVILKAIPVSKSELSQYAPKIFSTNVPPGKISDVIGPGGKIIKRITAETGVEIEIKDDGRVYVASTDVDSAERAIKLIQGITGDIKPGEVYKGKVMRIMPFGAFVEFLPGKEGLVHISKLDTRHTRKVEDVVNVGDEIPVKVIEIDNQGRINLSRKDALPENERSRDDNYRSRDRSESNNNRR